MSLLHLGIIFYLVPSKPRITHINNQTPTSFYVNWEPPKEINGRLIKYELQWIYNEDVKSRYIAGHLINTMMAYISELCTFTDLFKNVFISLVYIYCLLVFVC